MLKTTRLLRLTACGLFCAAFACRPAAARADVSSHQVIAAIRRGVLYLLKHERRTKPWEETGMTIEGNGEKGGESALVLESLLTVGQSLHMRQLNIFSPPMRRAIHYVGNLKSPDTYVVALQANAMTLLPPKAKYLAVLKRDRAFLKNSLFPQGAYGYSWRSGVSNRRRHWDNSNSQYGVLGMWAVAHARLAVPPEYWQKVRRHWINCQYASGTWGYWMHRRPPGPNDTSSRPHSMTSAGLASLFICDEFLQTGSAASADPAVIRGLHWLNRHFNSDTGNMYTLYGYVRTGLACGLQDFRGQNWYRKIAADVLADQHHDGSWSADIHHPRIGSRFVGTAYALLILARGLSPVVFSKLDYGTHYYGQWNAHPRDDANITSWMSLNFETPLNWQVVSLRAGVRNWLESPVLLITGSRDPHFSAADIAKLQNYVHAGGMVLCSCDDNSAAFRKAMIRYGQKVAGPHYPIKMLPADSSIYTMQSWYKFAHSPGVLGISNGVRYLWLISRTDIAAAWQSRNLHRKAPWELAADIYFYATGKAPLEDKLHSLAAGGPPLPARRIVHLAAVKYAGNWAPEPGAWPRLAQYMHAHSHTLLTIKTVSASKLNPAATPLAVLTGVKTLPLTDSQIAAIKHFINHGGTLLVDACGGKTGFTNVVARTVAKILPNADLVKLGRHSRIYTGAMPGGQPTRPLAYRKFTVETHRRSAGQPLYGVKIAGRWGIIFSPLDISSGLFGTNTWGINGFAPKTAQKLAQNIVAYVAQKYAVPIQPGKKVKPKPPSAGAASSSNGPGI